MIDESVFEGIKLGVVGNICRDVKTAPPAADERLFHDGETPTDSIIESMLQEGNAKLLQTVRDRGLATSLDLNWDPFWGIAPEERIQSRKEAVRRVLPLVDLVHGNVREQNIFADSTEIATTLERLTGWGAGAAVRRLGIEGRLLLPRRDGGFAQCSRRAARPCDGKCRPAKRLHDVAPRADGNSDRREVRSGQSHRRRVHRRTARFPIDNQGRMPSFS